MEGIHSSSNIVIPPISVIQYLRQLHELPAFKSDFGYLKEDDIRILQYNAASGNTIAIYIQLSTIKEVQEILQFRNFPPFHGNNRVRFYSSSIMEYKRERLDCISRIVERKNRVKKNRKSIINLLTKEVLYICIYIYIYIYLILMRVILLASSTILYHFSFSTTY